MFGAMIAATIPTMATTTRASSSVKPDSRLPAADIRCLAGAAGLFVGAEGEHIHLTVITRHLVEVRVTPWIDQRAVLFEIWPIPAIRALRRRDQPLEALLRRSVSADVQPIEFERRNLSRDLHFR